MHEMSIALGIVRIAEEEMEKREGDHVSAIELEIGALSGIEIDSLDFVWPVATKQTILENAKRLIAHRDGRARCMECDTLFEIKGLSDGCPTCGSYLKEIVQGQEMRVVALTIEYKQKTAITD